MPKVKEVKTRKKSIMMIGNRQWSTKGDDGLKEKERKDEEEGMIKE